MVHTLNTTDDLDARDTIQAGIEYYGDEDDIDWEEISNRVYQVIGERKRQQQQAASSTQLSPAAAPKEYNKQGKTVVKGHET